ncbi:MAG: catalase [Leptospiraceae bacterium]|nr:catalase [Leptospiraceae bacterium]
MVIPSKDWKEIIEIGEEKEFEFYAIKLGEIQKKKNGEYGKGRGLHRKQIAGLKGSFEVLDSIPDYAKFGLFAKPGTYETIFRLSNGGMEVRPDFIPDIRGFSFKVKGVEGESALGNGKVDCQDFTLINHSKFSFPRSKEFLGLVFAVSEGGFGIISYMMKTFGLIDGIKKAIDSSGAISKPFSGFGTEQFYSAAPISCGPYACKVRILPESKQEDLIPVTDWAFDLQNKLRDSNLKFDFQLQFFISEDKTPIEDASIDWKEEVSPFITVGKIIIPSQEVDTSNSSEFSKFIEASVFDPWNGLADHRPLGNIMRTRKYVYYESQKNRGV